MQSPKITANNVGAAFELQTYGSNSGNTYLLLHVFQVQEDRYRFFAGKSINDKLHKVPVTFSRADTCHIPLQNTLTQFHVRPIEDIKSLFPQEDSKPPHELNHAINQDHPYAIPWKF
ncbi:hypothetical protein ACTL6P_06830 [Endozoicomonas acroporae]|uniref:hypothetical protein n=1 Tax=Endozoicomonas acroporae TaxID=1701104 RepID=UPI000C767B89|nr:hypothetical protein [Endozoicomonas acroporae]